MEFKLKKHPNALEKDLIYRHKCHMQNVLAHKMLVTIEEGMSTISANIK